VEVTGKWVGGSCCYMSHILSVLHKHINHLRVMLVRPSAWRALLCSILFATAASAEISNSSSCTVIITGPAIDASTCDGAAFELSSAPDLTTNRVRFIKPWHCTSCTPLSGNNTSCNAILTATLDSRVLLQVCSRPLG